MFVELIDIPINVQSNFSLGEVTLESCIILKRHN